MAHAVMTQQTGPLAPRSKTGCFTCRRRHKKCDEVRPTCTGCVRNHLLCHWPSAAGSASLDTSVVSEPISSPSETSGADCSESLTPVIIRQPTVLPPLFRNERNGMLFQHFANVTSLQLASRVYPENAYLTYNLRISAGFDCLQHAILAISSCHLSYMHSSSIDVSLDHYIVSIRGLTHAITRWKSCSAMERVVMVATSLALCQYEVLTANTQGSLYHHLRALKWMLAEMQKNKRVYDEGILGFFAEQYQYLAIVSHLGFGVGFKLLKGSFEDNTTVQSLELLNKGSPIYGLMFGRAHHLFALIPRIHKLAQQRWNNQETSVDNSSYDLEKEYSQLLLEISSWEVDEDDFDVSYQLSGLIYQQALRIYLHLAHHGPRQPTTGLIAKIEPCIELCLQHIESLPPDAHTWTTSMWPSLIIGSCMFLQSQRNRLSRILTDSLIRFPTLEGMNNALLTFWKELDSDPDLYGPDGFEVTMKKNNIILCVG